MNLHINPRQLLELNLRRNLSISKTIK